MKMYKVFNDKTTTDKIQMSGRKTYSSGMLCGYVSPQKLKEFCLKLEVKSFSKRSNEVICILGFKNKRKHNFSDHQNFHFVCN